jgi:dTDP-4-amino-4,6-dideoxygalactose transaminase
MIDIDKLGKSRHWVLNALTAENIGVGVHYLPVHLHPFYRDVLTSFWFYNFFVFFVVKKEYVVIFL